MEKFEYNGENYIFYNGKFLDEHYVEVNLSLANEISNFYFSKKDYKNMNRFELFEFIKELKTANLHNLCINIIEFGIQKYNNDITFIKPLLPVLTSSYRLINQPQIAIEKFKFYTNLYNCGSVALHTSIAAAYCDIGDFNNAIKHADIAYAKQGGSIGEENELSLVYKRIKKETEEY